MDLKKSIIKHKGTLTKIGLVVAIIVAFVITLQEPVNSNYIDRWISAIIKTVIISVVAIVMGFVIGVVVGLGRISHNFLINGAATVYVEILRGVPLLIQIFFMYFALAIYVPSINDAAIAATLALGLNSGAYQAEIIRGGIQSIPRGQLEAARSSGMSYFQSMRHVILPQGFRLIIPPMTNEYVTVIKDSSLAYAIGAMEITWLSTKIITIDFDPLTTYIFVALIYFTLTTFTSNIMRVVERRFRIPGYMGAE
ncbi:MAG: amino acid ABC transporter permease [Methanomassiliicoccus sp.]|nr:amino acid ABC transporter permease [Methanomassiliicoccus sp.]